MHIGPLGLPELIIILLVILVIFGPKNLPKLGNAIGRTVKSLRDGMDGSKKEAKEDAESAAADVPEVVEASVDSEASEEQ